MADDNDDERATSRTTRPSPRSRMDGPGHRNRRISRPSLSSRYYHVISLICHERNKKKRKKKKTKEGNSKATISRSGKRRKSARSRKSVRPRRRGRPTRDNEITDTSSLDSSPPFLHVALSPAGRSAPIARPRHGIRDFCAIALEIGARVPSCFST